MDKNEIRSLYAAFDLYPSYKGAATHIKAFSEVFFEEINPGLLFTLGSNQKPEKRGNHILYNFNWPIKNYLRRAQQFSTQLFQIAEQLEHLEVCHYRDVWSGLPIINADFNGKTIFEVNGLPSVELKYRYPQISKSTIAKIRQMERDCLVHSDLIITPSNTTREFLISGGVPERKIRVIPNGADIPDSIPQSEDIDQPYIIYVGALQPWQGVDVLLKAFALLQDLNLKLLICSSQHKKFSKPYIKLADRLGISKRVIWKNQLEKIELQSYIHSAEASIAPLKNTERNIRQGCAPLKILESMASETLIIASDLPPVREIVQHNVNGILVRPDRPAELARNIRIVMEHSQFSSRVSAGGLETIKSKYQWNQQKEKLRNIYQDIYAIR